MKKLLTLIFITSMAGAVSAQLVNNGGTITIQSGATLVVESDITNSSGTITNEGIIDVKGDFISNTATLVSTATNAIIKFSGTEAGTFTPPADVTVRRVEMAKTGATAADNQVTLGSSFSIDENLVFVENNNNLVLGANSVTLSPTSEAMTGTTTGSYVVTDGMGSLVKEGLTTTAFTFPVGNDNATRNDITLTNTAGPAEDVGVRVLASVYADPTVPSGDETADAVNATWEITEATAGGNTLTATPSWENTDEDADFVDDEVSVYYYDAGSYSEVAANTDISGANTITNAGYDALNGTGYLIVADKDKAAAALLAVKMFLQGPYSAANSLMNDGLRSGGLLPAAEPYGAMTTFTHVGGETNPNATDFEFAAGTSDDIVDWVFVEMRNGADAVIATRSALLRRDGNVVDVDGNAVKFANIPTGDYSIVMRHRNHLGVKSASTVNMTKGATATFDFTTAAAQSIGSDQPDLGSGVFGMWAGDTTQDGNIRYLASSFPFPFGTPSDANAILFNALNNVPNGSLSTYSIYDVNMDGSTRYLASSFPFPFGTPSDANFILFNVLQNVPNGSKAINY